MVNPDPAQPHAAAQTPMIPGRRQSDAFHASTAGHSTSSFAGLMRWFFAGMLALACALSLALAWRAQSQVKVLEQELVRRQDVSQGLASEANASAKQAEQDTRESLAKIALLDAKLTEVALHRSQLEELVLSLTRSRDDSLLGDIEAAIRGALQQTAITGSSEPLVAALRQSEERLGRAQNGRLQAIRRAIVRDLDRIRAVGVTDVGVLTLRLDEAVRLIDDLPLVTSRRNDTDLLQENQVSPTQEGSPSSPPGPAVWSAIIKIRESIWSEIKSLVRVSRVDQPHALLLAPEQAFFLRENLKLRLLNARLALLSRQFDAAQSDLLVALDAIERYFDAQSRRTVHAAEVVRQVSAQARAVAVPRPDDTLAALAAIEAGR